MSAHSPVRMYAADTSSFIKRGGNGAGRSWRVWSWIYACPTCGLQKTVLRNPNVGKSFFCHGDRVIGSRAAPSSPEQAKTDD